WPSRSRYRKNASPQERERIRSAVDIVVSFCLGSDPCPPLGNRGGVDWSGSTGQCALRRTSYLTRTPRTNEITIPRIRPGGCESGHRTVFFYGGRGRYVAAIGTIWRLGIGGGRDCYTMLKNRDGPSKYPGWHWLRDTVSWLYRVPTI